MTLALAIARSGNLTARVQRRLRAVQARARYRLGMPSPQVLDAQIDPAFRHPIDAGRAPMLAARYRELFPLAVAPEIAEAQRLAAHQFTFLGQRAAHGDLIAWSRDPISGRDWPRDFSRDIAYRGPDRLGDIKLPWELSKHQYFFTLGKAAWLSGDTALAMEIVRQIDQWIDDNPADGGIHWISALEAGTRAISWIMSYPFYAESADGRFRSRLLASLARHLLFVEQHLSTGPFANTHLVGEAAALVVGGLFVACRHSERWIATGLRILDEEMERQVTADGVHAERSVAYHRFFLDQYYLVAGLLAANGQSMSTGTLRRVERATAYLIDVLFADGTAPAFGDADDARGLWFRADAPADYRSLLALGSVVFGRGDFKTVSGGVTEEVLWLLGLEGVAAFDALAPELPDAASAAYPDAGYYIMRGGRATSDSTLVFDCGPLGFGVAGHGHADALSFQLHAEGYPFFVDAGTFSYNIDYAWRDAFRGTRAHNTLTVDGQDQSVPGDRMSWKTAAQSRATNWLTTRWFDLVDGEHDGYRRLPDPVSHRRVVCFLKPNLWVVWDEVTASASHELELLLHLRPDCLVEPAVGEQGVVLTGPQGQRLRAWMAAPESQTHGFAVLEGNDQERAAWFSPAYAVREPSRALQVKREVTGSSSFITCLTTSAQPRPVVTEHDGAIAIRARDGDSEQSLFYRRHGPAIYQSDSVQFDGDALFERRQAGGPSAVWASRFHELVLDGRLEVRSPAVVNKLVMGEIPGAVAIDVDEPGQLQIRASDGIQVVINGRVR